MVVDLNPTILFKDKTWRNEIGDEFKEFQSYFRHYLMEMIQSWRTFEVYYHPKGMNFDTWSQKL